MHGYIACAPHSAGLDAAPAVPAAYAPRRVVAGAPVLADARRERSATGFTPRGRGLRRVPAAHRGVLAAGLRLLTRRRVQRSIALLVGGAAATAPGCEGDSGARAVVVIVCRVELRHVVGGNVAIGAAGVGTVGPSAQEQVGEGVEPGFVALARRGGDFDGAARGHDDEAFAVEARGHGVVVCHHADGFDGDALRLELRAAGGRGVALGPVESSSVWMHPEEASVTGAGHVAAAGLARVFPHVFADHGLGDGLNHAWVGTSFHTRHAIKTDVKAFVYFRRKG